MSLLWVATLRAESWALIRVLRSARVSLTWLLSPLLARDTNDRPAVIFQPSDSYTCGAIPLEHRHVARPRETRWAVASTMGGADRYAPRRVGAICARAAYKT